MASKDHYSRGISCPKCNKEGVLNISENDYDFMRKNDRQIDSVVGGFSARIVDDTEIEITCYSCKTIFSS